MEIRTCEEYVLAQLKDSQEQVLSLEMEVADLKRDLAEAVNTIKRLEDDARAQGVYIGGTKYE